VGASRVACYDKNGAFLGEEKFGARQLSCPAFGGTDLDMLYVTSARHWPTMRSDVSDLIDLLANRVGEGAALPRLGAAQRYTGTLRRLSAPAEFGGIAPSAIRLPPYHQEGRGGG
jgi:hypothetical protein